MTTKSISLISVFKHLFVRTYICLRNCIFSHTNYFSDFCFDSCNFYICWYNEYYTCYQNELSFISFNAFCFGFGYSQCLLNSDFCYFKWVSLLLFLLKFLDVCSCVLKTPWERETDRQKELLFLDSLPQISIVIFYNIINHSLYVHN